MTGSAPRIPLFPLSNVVLFPGVEVPLHVFEARYRQMTGDALEGERRIGMVTVEPAHVRDMAGDPPVFPIGCEGEIRQWRRLDDGRYTVALAGTNRFRILRELPADGERLYRVAEVERLEDPLEPVDKLRVMALRAAVLEVFAEIAKRHAPRAGIPDPQRFSGVDDRLLVNTLSQLLDFPAVEKQGLLDAPSVPARYERLLGLLRFRLAEGSGGAAASSSGLH